jgi:hypothetical protein
MANITDHDGGAGWTKPPRVLRRAAQTRFCVTEISSVSLLAIVLGLSTSLWLAIAAVV